VDGIFTEDPMKNPNPKLIKTITPKTVNQYFDMKHIETEFHTQAIQQEKIMGKLYLLTKLANRKEESISSEVFNGTSPGVLSDIILGRKHHGTLIVPD
jgi:uridylate kinase